MNTSTYTKEAELVLPNTNTPADATSEVWIRRMHRIFSLYDVDRVSTYRDIPGNTNRIEVRRFGSAIALLFPEVGFFNRVYNFSSEDTFYLDAITEFYEKSGTDFELIVPPYDLDSEVAKKLTSDGFQPSQYYARLCQDPRIVELPESYAPFSIRKIERSEGEKFFRVYLDGFGADPAQHDRAIANMRQLFDLSGLYFFMAEIDRRPAGVGMLYVRDGTGYLCAGATLPEFRNRGCQSALLLCRQKLARELDLDLLASWSHFGGASNRNMLRAGMHLSHTDLSWVKHFSDSQKL